MAGFSEPDDPYAADAEASTKASANRRQRSAARREFGPFANRLRQRPTTKQVPASEVPGQPLASNSRLQAHSDDDEDDYSDHYRFVGKPAAAAAPQSPALPLTPISPRWASSASSNGHDLQQNHLPYQQYHNHSATSSIATTATSPLTPASSVHSRSRQTSSASTSRFPGLSSHPVFPEPTTYYPDRPSPSFRDFPLIEEQDDIEPSSFPQSSAAHSAAAAASSRPPSRPSPDSRPPSSSRPSSRRTVEDAMLVENFSRPRNASLRQPSREALYRAPKYDAENPVLSSQQAPWPRTRRPSVSSSRSAATLASVNPRPSNEQLTASYPAPPRSVTPTAASAVNGVPNALGLSRPAMPPTRFDSVGSFASSSLHAHPRDRENMPWMADDEMRESYRSQLTASTGPSATFTGGTERSSLATKRSSRTSASMHGFRPGSTADDGGLSLEDVMGMYEKGFVDSTGPEDNDLDGDNDTQDIARLGRGESETSKSADSRNVGNKILEAMSEPLHIPSKPLAVPMGDGPYVIRDSAAFFRNSGLPSSVPNDVGSGMMNHHLRRPLVEKDEMARSKHDSAKLLDGDEQSPIRQQGSQRSKRTPSPSRSLTTETTMCDPDRPEPEIEGPSTFDPPPAAPSVSSPPTPTPPSQLYAAPTNEDPESRDRYGFRKSNQYITQEQYDKWNASYSTYLARRRKKWNAYLKESGLITDHPNRFPAMSAKTKRFVRKGIPPEWRGAAWFYYAGGEAILAKHMGVYDDLVARSLRGESKEVDAEAIERDLHRTFPDNAKFRFSANDTAFNDGASVDSFDEPASPASAVEPLIISKLRRVLHAFAIYNPRIGYCQSLNFLAGLLLLFVETEEQAFWLLNIITRWHLPGTHEMSLEGSKVDLGVLMGAVKDSMPAVWSKVGGELEGGYTRPATAGGGKVAKKGRKAKAAPVAVSADRLPPITLCMTAWFMSCFIGTLPIETTLRVWDVFFYEGSRTLFRIALAIFKLGESEIRAVQDPMEMFGVVQALPRRLLDCNMVMEATFKRRNGFGHLSQETIEERRAERRAELVAAAASANAVNRAAATGAVDAPLRTAATDLSDLKNVDTPAAAEMRRKGTLFGRRKERGWAAEV